MSTKGPTCRFCFSTVAETMGSNICANCLDYDIATSMALSVLDENDVEEKHVRAAVAAELVREYLRRSRDC